MYIGNLGRMVGVKCPTSQRVTPSERYSFRTTLGGVVKAQVGRGSRRVWDIGVGSLSTPSEVGAVAEFAHGVWGQGPFWFVPTDAPVVNMLTPGAASCDPATILFDDGAELLGQPPLRLADGMLAARSVLKTGDGSAVMGGPVPVLPNQPVTGSVYALGQGSIRLRFLDAYGAPVSEQFATVGALDEPRRSSVTAIAPGVAASVQLVLGSGVTQAARPAITWTSEPYEWGDGQGCAKAVVHALSRDLTKAWDNPRTGRWSDMAFTVQEVG